MTDDYEQLQEYVAAQSCEVVTKYHAALRREGNPLGALPLEEIRSAVAPILAAVVGTDARVEETARSIGQARARQLRNPLHSLRAAGTLYHCCAEAIVDGAERLEIARSVQARMLGDLHDAIMHQVTAAALPYSNVLLRQIHSAQREERKRVARDLHDRAGYAIAIALQQIELRQIAIERGEDDGSYIAVLGHSLREAAAMVQEIAIELGQTGINEGLVEALEDFISIHGEERVSMQVTGAEHLNAPEWVIEQAYLALREGVRNALRHSHSPRIRVRIDAVPAELRAEVADEGAGFRQEDLTTTSSGKGMVSMYERVQLLGGGFTVTSSPGYGTILSFTIPLPPP